MLIGEDIIIWLRPVVQRYFLSTAGKAVDNAVTALSMHPTVILRHKDRLFESVPTKRAERDEIALEMHSPWFHMALDVHNRHGVLSEVVRFVVEHWPPGTSVYASPRDQPWVRLHRYA